ncbi:hypothetical protein A3K80_02040 [Candidatus Bathyarchaeota archaeon RBG_13_38_9]|nr:MAG: hypothetical protein A3K80_02040 [Candidatus Bathyarchaeota archaeon RBG_13_38_9]
MPRTQPEIVKLKISTERFLKTLHQLKIEYAMIGGIPAGFYGEPRFTQDLDFTADPKAIIKNFPELIQELEQNNFMLTSSRPTIKELEKTTSLRFIDLRNKVIIDLVIHPKGFSWDTEILQRRRKEGLLTAKMKIWCIAVEDLILMKIANATQQDLIDIEKIISKNFKGLDWKYLRRRAKKFKLNRKVEEIYYRYNVAMS